MRAYLEKGGWVALANVEPWIDDRYPLYAGLLLKVPDLDAKLAGALEDGEIKARGYRDGVDQRRVSAPPGVRVTVRSLLGKVTVATVNPAVGVMRPLPHIREYRDVEFDAATLGAWCASRAGEPRVRAPGPEETKGSSDRAQPKRSPVSEVIAELFGEDWPVAPFGKPTVNKVGDASRAKGISASDSTIRRALRNGR